MTSDASPIQPSLSIEAGKLPHQEQISAQKWGHTFTKIAYASAAVAAVAFTVALVAAAVFFTGGAAALPILIAFGAVFALTGGGAAVAKFFQEKMAQKELTLNADQAVASRLYEVLGKDAKVEDFQVVRRVQDKPKLTEFLDLVCRRNRGENISNDDIQKALTSVPVAEGEQGEKARRVLNKAALKREPSNVLPYANLIPRLQAIMGAQYDPKIAARLLSKNREPVDQVRVSNVLSALEGIQGNDEINIRNIGDALLDSTGGGDVLDNLLYSVVTQRTHMYFKPLIEAIKEQKVTVLERDTFYKFAYNALTANPDQLADLKNQFNGSINHHQEELFDAILKYKAFAEWNAFYAEWNEHKDEMNPALMAHQFLRNMQMFPTKIDLLDEVAKISGNTNLPFMSFDDIENSLSTIPAGPILIAVNNGLGEYSIRQFVVQDLTKGYREYDALMKEYYPVKAESGNKRLVEVIKLPDNITPDVVGQTVRSLGGPNKSAEAIELEYQSRIHELNPEKNLRDQLKTELERHNIPEADAKFLLDNFPNRSDRNELIRMLEYIRVIGNAKGPDRAYHIIKATTPFFNLLLGSKSLERDGIALKIISKLITPQDEVGPYRTREIAAAAPRLGLKPGDLIAFIKSGEMGEPILMNHIYQNDKDSPFVSNDQKVSLPKSDIIELTERNLEPYDKKEFLNGKAEIVARIDKNKLNASMDDPTLKEMGGTYKVRNSQGDIVEVKLQKQFESEINRYTSIIIDGKIYRDKESLVQALYTACNDNSEIMLNLTPFLSQAAIASSYKILTNANGGNNIQKSIALQVDFTENAVKIKLETSFDQIDKSAEDRAEYGVLQGEFASSKEITIFKEELKNGNAEKSNGIERVFKLPKSSRVSDFEMILSKVPQNEVVEIRKGLGALEEYYLKNINSNLHHPKKLNEILQPLLGKLHESKMKNADKRVVLAAIHRLSSRDVRTLPITFEEAFKYSKDHSQLYMIEITTNRQLILRKGATPVIKCDINNPIVTQEMIDRAGVEFEKDDSTSQMKVDLDPIELNNYIQTADLQETVPYPIETANGVQNVTVNPQFVKDVNRALFIINGKALKGSEVVKYLSEFVSDPEELRVLAMLLNQSSAALTKFFTSFKFTDLVAQGVLGNPVHSGNIFIVTIDKDRIHIAVQEQSVYVDTNNVGKKNELTVAEIIVTKEMLKSQDFSKASYAVSQTNVPLNSFDFLWEEFRNEIPVLQNNLSPLSSALLKDYLAFKKSIENNPNDAQLAQLLEKQDDLLLSIGQNNKPQLLNALIKITALPDISNRLPGILQNYRKETIHLFGEELLNVPGFSKFKINKVNQETPLTFIDSHFDNPDYEWMRDSLQFTADLPNTVLGTLANLPKHISKITLDLADGQKAAYPAISAEYLDKAKIMIQNKEMSKQEAVDKIHGLLGNNPKNTELFLQVVTQEHETSLLNSAQQWVNLHLGTEHKIKNPQVLHRIDIVDGIPVYTLEISAAIVVNGKTTKFNLTREIQLDQKELQNGNVQPIFVRDNMKVSK